MLFVPKTANKQATKHAKTEMLYHTGTPPSPVGPLELRAAEGLADHDFRSTSDAGLYYMDPVNAVPAEESSDEMRYPTVPIIRVTLGRKIKYIWMV